MHTEKILIIGANGQLGTVLTQRLQEKWGLKNVIASDIYPSDQLNGKFEILDATNFDGVQKIVKHYRITQIYHLAAVLSANGEKDPLKTWNINMTTLFNVLETSRLNSVEKVFFPSSIAVFGDNVQKELTPQYSILTPSTVYGMSKVAGENWVSYYHEKYGLDVRSIRYPGVIGYQSLPGGGTTDYAVEIYHKAMNNEPFECFLKNTATLPMIYMEDAIRATIELMDAPKTNITVRSSYNLAGMSFSPMQIAKTIQKLYPDFKIAYKPDFRQEIADSWPQSIDDSCARKDWNWMPNYNLESMTEDMIKNLKLREECFV
ncbi:NAD-dependent epimerase/dehydratase family protein [Gelidibacter japonicus]|jgi:nucleoside-diphosphate-sugar epimerase|uniref:NAD-dependent epimerase/dehydratase family protein n=1 Tax=Gelidibacter japonicus TaxID=1962232 RepID=UPI002AFE22FA|nr:NAD-dependent epimerase/dehydratase family protein [Gelidibacter japonicus]